MIKHTRNILFIVSLGLHSHCAALIWDVMSDEICQNTGGLLNTLCVYEGGSTRAYDTNLSSGQAHNHIMAGSEGIFYKSDGRGVSFREIVPDWGDEEAVKHGIDKTFSIGYGNIYDIIYAQGLLIAAADLNRIFVSYDRGESWSYNPNVFDLRVGGREPEGRYLVDFRGIAYGDGVYIAVSSRTGIFKARNPMGHFERIDCRGIAGIPEDQGDCNSFLRGIAYGSGYFVIWGGGQSGATVNVFLYSDDKGSTWKLLSQAFYVENVKFYRGRWYYSGRPRRDGVVAGDFEIHGQTGLRYTESSHPASKLHLYPYYDLDSATSLPVFGLGEDKVKLVGARRDARYLIIDDGTGIRNCRRDTIDGDPNRLCDIFNTHVTGVHTDMLHTNGLWRIITTDGYYYYSEHGYKYTQIRPTLQSLNAILGY